jgi:hypothetical protein
MATKKLDDITSQLADELGISPESLASMDMSKVKQLINRGDLDPAQKAQLIRAQLQKFKDFVSVADDVLADVAKDG